MWCPMSATQHSCREDLSRPLRNVIPGLCSSVPHLLDRSDRRDRHDQAIPHQCTVTTLYHNHLLVGARMHRKNKTSPFLPVTFISGQVDALRISTT